MTRKHKRMRARTPTHPIRIANPERASSDARKLLTGDARTPLGVFRSPRKPGPRAHPLPAGNPSYHTPYVLRIKHEEVDAPAVEAAPGVAIVPPQHRRLGEALLGPGTLADGVVPEPKVVRTDGANVDVGGRRGEHPVEKAAVLRNRDGALRPAVAEEVEGLVVCHHGPRAQALVHGWNLVGMTTTMRTCCGCCCCCLALPATEPDNSPPV